MSGIFRATSRDAEGHLGQTQGHLGATQGMCWENIRGQGNTLWNILREQEGTLEKTRHHGENGEQWAQVSSAAIPHGQVPLLPLLPLCSPPGALGTPAQPLHVDGEGSQITGCLLVLEDTHNS